MTKADVERVQTMRRQTRTAGWTLKTERCDSAELLSFVDSEKRQMSPEFASVDGLWAWLQFEVDESQELARLERNRQSRRNRVVKKAFAAGQGHELIEAALNGLLTGNYRLS